MEVSNLFGVNLSEINLVLLDLDNTLYEYNICHKLALQSLITEIAGTYMVSTEQVHQLYKTCRKRVNDQNLGTASSHSRLFYIQGMVELLSGFTDSNLIVHLNDLYWSTYIDSMKLYDDAIPFLESCIAKHIPIVLVTDMVASVQFQKIHKLNISKYFKFIVTSEEAGVEKPHPFIFELAINKILAAHLPVNSIAVVGDNTKKDLFQSFIYNTFTYHIIRND